MSVVVTPVKFTFEDYLLFPEDGKRHELIDGEHYMSPAPTIRHQNAAATLFVAMRNYLERNLLGQAFHAPIDVILSELDVVQPDLIFISSARAAIITEANIQGAPDLVVEITSPSTRMRDESIKRKLYERYGVEEYWVIDPELETVKIYRRVAAGFQRVAELAMENQDRLTTPLLPDFDLPLQKLFS